MEDEREEELETLAAIFPELVLDQRDAFTATLELPVSPTNPLLIRFVLPEQELNNANHHLEAAHELRFAHLPPFALRITLPLGYPADSPPVVNLSTQLEWLPKNKINQLEHDVLGLWEDCGRSQMLFGYIDHLQQAAERGFDLDGNLTLPAAQESDLVSFNTRSVETVFNAGTYDCGICLDPKKGVSCTCCRRYKLGPCDAG